MATTAEITLIIVCLKQSVMGRGNFLPKKIQQCLREISFSICINSETFEHEIEKYFNDKIPDIKDNRFKEAQISSLQIKRS